MAGVEPTPDRIPLGLFRDLSPNPEERVGAHPIRPPELSSRSSRIPEVNALTLSYIN
ncbi:MAG: hypothetical protein ABJN42_21065 [Roseibium sp.]|uniref:hypothetical protein n=1 Tax=Roseibium sp. TaxID=1936156 RepID=UPI003298C039